MADAGWKTKEFLEDLSRYLPLAQKELLEVIKQRILYLNSKLRRYNFLLSSIQELSKKYFPENRNVEIDFRVIKIQDEYTNHCELMAHLVYSCFDVFALIVNEILAVKRLSERRVQFTRLIEVGILTERDDQKQVKNRIENVLNSEDFKYLSAFTNTIKHRGVVDIPFELFKPSRITNIPLVPVISTFKYNDSRFEKKTIEDFIEMLNHNINSIVDLGIVLHRLMGRSLSKA